MADVSDIRAKLKTRLETVSGLHCYARLPDQVQVPAAIVHIPRMQYRQAMGNVNAITVEIVLLVAEWGPGFDRAQDALDSYLDDTGATSIKAALEGDKTLSSTVDTLHVPGWRDYAEQYWVNGIPYCSVTLDVEVWD